MAVQEVPYGTCSSNQECHSKHLTSSGERGRERGGVLERKGNYLCFLPG